MDETIYVILKVLFDFALEVLFSIAYTKKQAYTQGETNFWSGAYCTPYVPTLQNMLQE